MRPIVVIAVVLGLLPRMLGRGLVFPEVEMAEQKGGSMSQTKRTAGTRSRT